MCRSLLQTKGVLTAQENVSELQRILAPTSQLPQPTSQLVKQAFAYIQQNYPRAFSLTELAETIGVSKSYLAVFKAGHRHLPLGLFKPLTAFKKPKSSCF